MNWMPSRDLDELVAEKIVGWIRPTDLEAKAEWKALFQDAGRPNGNVCHEFIGYRHAESGEIITGDDYHRKVEWYPPELNGVRGQFRDRVTEYSERVGKAWEAAVAFGADRGLAKPNLFQLYKPTIQVELYEHDEICNVTIGRCKTIQNDSTDIHVQRWCPKGRTCEVLVAWTMCLAMLKARGFDVPEN